MKISYAWLQDYFDTPLPSVAELSDAITFHAFEIDGVEEINGDSVLDVKVLPDRTHDCLSYRGVAQEVSAILDAPLKSDPLSAKPDLSKTTDTVGVEIHAPELCLRYIAGHIKDVKVGPSPEWLVSRLASMGQRSINNVVDATNFVMFNLGQPLHAFDAGKMSEKDGKYAIEVRLARQGEKMVALDQKEYTLMSSNLLIVDANTDTPVGIAGVKGGTPAAIDETTTDIIIESANFDGVSVRKTGKALSLRTDASVRFENVISPELAAYGMHAVVELILSLAGGEVAGFADVYPSPQPLRGIAISAADVNRIHGTTISTNEVEAIIKRLGWSYGPHEDGFLVTAPLERLDMTITEDVAADIGRIYGLDHIPSVAPAPFPEAPKINKRFYYVDRIRDYLSRQGFSEIYSSVFVLEGHRQVLNRVDSDRPYLRGSLASAVTEGLQSNFRNKELLGLSEIRLFEIGTVWKETEERTMLCIGTMGGKTTPKASDFLRGLLAEFDVTVESDFPQAPVVEVDLDELLQHAPDPLAYQELPTLGDLKYKPYSRYPVILRDVAVWTPAGTEQSAVEKILTDTAGDYRVRTDLFDRFEKDGKISYAFHLVFQAPDKTLTDEEINAQMVKVYAALGAAGYEIR
jgi:phenylalanyl-tRNA synthetase beta chain